MKRLMFVFMLLLLSALYVNQAVAQKESHKDYAEMKLKECNDCHKAEGIAPNHDADWGRGHRVTAGKSNNNCKQCHTQKFCLDCHVGGGSGDDLAQENAGFSYKPNTHRSDFIQLHPIKAKDNPQSCNRCHDVKTCIECHDRFPKGSLRIKSHMPLGTAGQKFTWNSDHSSEARRNLQSCQTCHPEGDVCIQCHRSGRGIKSPHPGGFNFNNYNDKNGGKMCLKCHRTVPR